MAPQPASRPIGSLQGLIPLTLTANVESTAAPDRDYLLKEIKFFFGFAATTDAATTTVAITVGNQALFGGQKIPVALLQSEFTNGSDFAGDDTLITFRLPQTVPVARNMTVKIETSAPCNVLLVCIDPVAL